MDESAIDDDDDESEWEDSVEDSGRSSVDEKNLFQRVDSKAQLLPTRRSLIALMLEKKANEKALLGNAAQGPSPPSRRRPSNHHARHQQQQQHLQPPPVVASPNDSDEAPLMMRRGGPPRPASSPAPEAYHRGAPVGRPAHRVSRRRRRRRSPPCRPVPPAPRAATCSPRS